VNLTRFSAFSTKVQNICSFKYQPFKCPRGLAIGHRDVWPFAYPVTWRIVWALRGPNSYTKVSNYEMWCFWGMGICLALFIFFCFHNVDPLTCCSASLEFKIGFLRKHLFGTFSTFLDHSYDRSRTGVSWAELQLTTLRPKTVLSLHSLHGRRLYYFRASSVSIVTSLWDWRPAFYFW